MLEKIKRCFALEAVNTARQYEIDIARGFAIIFMVWVHVMEEMDSFGSTIPHILVEYVLSEPFAAPVFLTTLGVGLVYSRHTSPKALLDRGINILVLGFLLNIVRFSLPIIWDASLLNEPFPYVAVITWQISVDVLQFAGLTFIYFSFAKRMGWSKSTLVMIAVLCSLLGTLLKGVTVDHYIGKQLLGYFWASSDETFFPFLTWIIFPTFGYVFGSYWVKCRDKGSFYKLVSPAALILSCGYIAVCLIFGLSMYAEGNSYYHMNLLDACFIMMLMVGLFGLHYGLLQVFPRKIFTPLLSLSRNITEVYCIHWVILGFSWVCLKHFFGKTQLPFWELTQYAFAILVISGFLAAFYNRELTLFKGGNLPVFLRRTRAIAAEK